MLDRETDRIIGYEKTYIGADPGYETPMSDEELMAKAVEELSKFTDVDYYKEKRIENSSIGPIERKNIWFYNKAGDVEFADSSWVKLTKGGVVLQVKNREVDLLGSDAHDTRSRLPNLGEAYDILRNAGLSGEADRLAENAGRLWEGKRLLQKD